MTLPVHQPRKRMPVSIANAPVSYGAFELTVGFLPLVPDAGRVLDEVADAGYAGIDLGPPGYLGDENSLAGALRERGLSLAGGYLPLPLTDDELSPDTLEEVDTLLATFAAAADTVGDLVAKPTLADAGSEARAARIGRAPADEDEGLDDRGWRRLCRNLQLVADRCRRAGFEPTFHHHAGTHVEAPWEIDRVLDGTDVDLCLDTGHLVVGGGDPLEELGRLGSRVNHVHLKDVRRDVVREIVEDAAPVTEIWRRKAFCRLGDGDLEVVQFIEELRRMEFSGWMVVEQDRLPETEADVAEMIDDQRDNRVYLSDRGW